VNLCAVILNGMRTNNNTPEGHRLALTTFEFAMKAVQLNMLALNKSSSQMVGGKRLSIDEAVMFTGLSKKRIYYLTGARMIPHQKLGNQLFFFEHQLTQWMYETGRKSFHLQSDTYGG